MKIQPIEYNELAIQFRPGEGNMLEARVTNSPGRLPEEGTTFSLPWGDRHLEAIYQHLDFQVTGVRRDWNRPPAPEDEPEVKVPETLGALGKQLFDFLNEGAVGTYLTQALRELHNTEGLGLRLRLRFDVEDERTRRLANLPWEALRLPFNSGLGLESYVSIVRHLEIEKPVTFRALEGDLGVLLVTASPSGGETLNLEPEARELERSLGMIPGIRVTTLRKATTERLRAELCKGHHVLHFMCHGESEAGRGYLVLEDGSGGPEKLDIWQLSLALAEAPELRLITINACRSAFYSSGGYSSVATSLVHGGFPAVAAMQFSIEDTAARYFSGKLYQQLAVGQPLETAILQGRREIARRRGDTPDWASPVLYMRRQDGRLFPLGGAPVDRIETQIAIQSYEHDFRELKKKHGNSAVLDLREHFRKLLPNSRSARWLGPEQSWNDTVYPRVKGFLEEHARANEAINLELHAHTSVAFAAGHVMGSKAGRQIKIYQPSHNRSADWQSESEGKRETRLWHAEPRETGNGGPDTALVLSVARPAIQDAENYIEQELGSRIGKILHLTVAPKPSPGAVKDDLHAVQLAYDVDLYLSHRTPEERKGAVHIFASAPNALIFFVGQLAQNFGPTIVYEYDFDASQAGNRGIYFPAFRFPVGLNAPDVPSADASYAWARAKLLAAGAALGEDSSASPAQQ